MPRELTEGLEPIRILRMRPDYKDRHAQAHADREATIARKMAILRSHFDIKDGRNCWYFLCLALAQELYTGFRIKEPLRPLKYTPVVRGILVGEMQRELNQGATSQQQAAERLASREPWMSFLEEGRHRRDPKAKDRDRADNLLYQYTRIPKHQRKSAERSFGFYFQVGQVGKWRELVEQVLANPSNYGIAHGCDNFLDRKHRYRLRVV